MVTEPAQSAVSTFAAGMSAGALALFGVSYFGLLWALFGALVSLMFSSPQSRGQALAAVIGGTLCGAVLADLAALLIPGSIDPAIRHGAHLALAFVIGAGAKQILAAFIKALLARIDSFGGTR